MNSRRIESGMRSASATADSLSILMEPAGSGPFIHLDAAEMNEVLDAVAEAAPGLLHEALERRMLRHIARQVGAAVEAARLEES